MPGPTILPYGDAAVARAAAALRAGGIVAVPTETVYGLAADATRPEAVARIYAAKGRPDFNPLIVHVSDLAAAERIAGFDGAAQALARAFWPGPLTLVLPLRTDAGTISADAVVVACRTPVGSARENEGQAVRFGMLTAPRSTVVQPSPVHAGMTAHPSRTLGQLLDRLVAPPA